MHAPEPGLSRTERRIATRWKDAGKIYMGKCGGNRGRCIGKDKGTEKNSKPSLRPQMMAKEVEVEFSCSASRHKQTTQPSQ